VFEPKFTITPRVSKALMAIEASRQAVARLPLTVPMLDSLRKTARLLSTHYSTQIEGNQLTPSQVEAVIAGGGNFPGRERDEAEVRNYYRALEFVEDFAGKKTRLTEQVVKTIHGLVMTGKKKATPYREGQNVIRDSRDGRIVYMPPEASDVPSLVHDLVAWIETESDANELPVPIVAGLAHYQFATVHPYFDGNGRTARLLTTLVLHRGGYGLNGIYSLEEYYAKNLGDYYQAIAVGPGHNYYQGRAEADVTKFVTYFCTGMADSFAKVRARAEEAGRLGGIDQAPVLRSLSPQQRKALSLFLRTKTVTSKEVAEFFSSSPRAAADLCVRWVDDGFLVVANPSKKARSYQLAERYEALVAAQSGDTPNG
jgi:Fic family protein